MTATASVRAPTPPITIARSCAVVRQVPAPRFLGTPLDQNPVEWTPEIGGYPQSRFPEEMIAPIERVLASSVWDELQIDRPTVWALGKNGRMLGVYIGGTSGVPHIGICVSTLRRSARDCDVAISDAVEGTLLHEAGHAYLETCGISSEYHDAKAEEVVEDAARHAWRTGDYAAQRSILDRFVQMQR